MLAPTSYIKGMGLGDKCALITDGRFSGGTAGAAIGHISPEAAADGEIGSALYQQAGLIEVPTVQALLDALAQAEADAPGNDITEQALLDLQRELGRDKRLVAEGRDMGTVVFPDADLKFFLDASVRQRALRRYEQYGKAGEQTLARIEQEIRQRDANDSSRDVAPLKPADDAVSIDSTAMDARQVVATMMAHVASLLSQIT